MIMDNEIIVSSLPSFLSFFFSLFFHNDWTVVFRATSGYKTNNIITFNTWILKGVSSSSRHSLLGSFMCRISSDVFISLADRIVASI